MSLITKDIISDFLRNNSSLCMQATGDSMWPFIREGDSISFKIVNFKNIRTGDIAVYIKNKNIPLIISHRIIKKTDDALIIKSDGALFHYDIIHEDALIGRLKSITRDGKSIRLDNRIHDILNKIIAWFSLNIPVVLFIFKHSFFLLFFLLKCLDRIIHGKTKV
ncbi:MAG: S24/S26 family peptidase [Candidatus Omnitrophota bacterium]|nr:S24/S26 family peptidase [Candidatus Omnitrophota bacterium]